MLSEKSFTDFSRRVVPFLHVTTKIPGRKGDDLFRRLNPFGGFPTLAFMDEEARILLRLHPTKRSIEGFREGLALATRFVRLRGLAASDPGSAEEFLILRLELQRLGFEEAVAEAKKLRLGPERRSRFEAALVETLRRMEVGKARRALEGMKLSPEAAARAREILQDLEIRNELAPLRRMRPGGGEPPYELAYALFKKGKVPSGKPHFDSLYWTSLSRAAFRKGDLETFEAAFEHLRRAFRSDRSGFLEGLETQLEILRKKRGKTDGGAGGERNPE